MRHDSILNLSQSSDLWLTKKQLKSICGITFHPHTIDRWIAAGKFPRPVKLGSTRQAPMRFSYAAVVRWKACWENGIPWEESL